LSFVFLLERAKTLYIKRYSVGIVFHGNLFDPVSVTMFACFYHGIFGRVGWKRY
jgi:hypothetical protein